MTCKKYYKLINKFAQLQDQQEILDKYPEIFNAICIYCFKLPKRIRKSLFDDLTQGNWEHLHETETEKKEPISELCKTLQWEVFYCSDKMSLDRLCRIHWCWQRIQHRLWMEEIDKELAKNKKEDI